MGDGASEALVPTVDGAPPASDGTTSLPDTGLGEDRPAPDAGGGADTPAPPDAPAGDANSGGADGGAPDATALDIAAAGDRASSDAPEGMDSTGSSDAATGRDLGAADGATADGGAAADASAGETGVPSPFRVLLFSRTAAFRHASIPVALATLMQLQAMGGYVAEATEDSTAFTATNLARFQVVVFALTSGDVLNPAQQTAFEGWVAAGGGYVGIHSASDTEFDWAFYGSLVGAYFRVHPAIQTATVRVEAATHPIMAGLPTAWIRRDEWYDFRTNPRPNVTVLATLDEATYSGGTMGADHPIIWARPTTGGGRAFYTALGHTAESYAEAPFRRHLLNGIRWVANR